MGVPTPQCLKTQPSTHYAARECRVRCAGGGSGSCLSIYATLQPQPKISDISRLSRPLGFGYAYGFSPGPCVSSVTALL